MTDNFQTNESYQVPTTQIYNHLETPALLTFHFHQGTESFSLQHGQAFFCLKFLPVDQREMAPSVDFNGKLFMEAPDSLSLSPNGNGGWFYSMAVTGVLNDVKVRGVEFSSKNAVVSL